MEKTTIALNPHLAFEPAIVDQENAVNLPAFLGFGEDDKDRLYKIMNDAFQACDSHTETLSQISKSVSTPQELMFLGFCYMTQIMKGSMQAKSVPTSGLFSKILASAIAQVVAEKMNEPDEEEGINAATPEAAPEAECK